MFLHEYTKPITDFKVDYDLLFKKSTKIDIGEYYFCSDIDVITDLYLEDHYPKQPSCSMLYFCYVKLSSDSKVITKPDLLIKRENYYEVYYFYYAGFKSDKMKIVDRDGILIIDPFPEFENAKLIKPDESQKSNYLDDLICSHTIYWMKFYDIVSNNNIEEKLAEKFEERKSRLYIDRFKSLDPDNLLLFSAQFHIYVSIITGSIYAFSDHNKNLLDNVFSIMIRTGQMTHEDSKKFTDKIVRLEDSIAEYSNETIGEFYEVWS